MTATKIYSEIQVQTADKDDAFIAQMLDYSAMTLRGLDPHCEAARTMRLVIAAMRNVLEERWPETDDALIEWCESVDDTRSYDEVLFDAIAEVK